MKFRLPKIFFFLAAGLSLWAIFFPAYLHSQSLTETDLFRGSHWENRVLNDHTASLEKKWKGIAGSDLASRIFREEGLSQPPLTPCQGLTPIDALPPLRC